MVHNWTKVFAFVFRHEAGSKGYRGATIGVTVLLLIVIPVVFMLVAGNSGDDVPAGNSIGRIIAVECPEMDIFGEIFETAPDVESAARMAEGDESAVVLAIESGLVNVLIPVDSSVTDSDAQALGSSLAAMLSPEPTEISEEDEGDSGTAQEIIGFVIPYVTLMVMYFMVLIYSQGVANAAIVEKTSKLMDLFLVSIRPAAVMLGKTLAIALAGILQLVMWLGGALGGFAIGVALVKEYYPESAAGIMAVLDSLGGLGQIFSPMTVIAAVCMIIVGFLMYCSLSAVGGALASRPEELSTTNTLFSMTLVISFLLCMFSGTSGGVISTARWMNFVPFTAILVVPGRLLTGAIAPVEAAISVGLTALFAFGLILLAGKTYTMTAFYRGEPMKPIKFITGIIRNKN